MSSERSWAKEAAAYLMIEVAADGPLEARASAAVHSSTSADSRRRA